MRVYLSLKSLWRRVYKIKNYLVFGANGFIGASLVEALSKDNLVYAIDRYSKPEIFRLNKRIKKIKEDVRKGSEILKKLKNVNVDGVVWLVGGVIPADKLDKERNILAATISIADIIRPYMESKKPVVVASSAGMLYAPGKTQLTERSRIDPWTWYGLEKLIMEKNLQLLAKDLDNENLRILRISSVYGERQPTDREQGVVAKLLNSALKNDTFNLYGSELARRDYIYVGDLVEIIEKFLKQKTKHQIYNVSTGKARSLKEVIETIEGITKKKIKTIKKNKRNIDPIDIEVSNKLLLREFDLNFTSFKEGLRKTIRWYESSQ